MSMFEPTMGSSRDASDPPSLTAGVHRSNTGAAGESQVPDNAPIAEMIQRSTRAFERDLPDLLKSHYRQWVAYHGEQCLGFARTETQLYQRCLRQNLREDEFVVRSVEPLMADDDYVYPPGA